MIKRVVGIILASFMVFTFGGNVVFAEENLSTRADFVTSLYESEGEPQSGDTVFEDVEAGSYYEKAVSWASETGIVNGISRTEFAPDAVITREQIATIIHRYAIYKGLDVSVGEETNILSYEDVDAVSEYAIAPIQWVIGSGLMDSETTINPKDNMTKEESTEILKLCIKMVKNLDSIKIMTFNAQHCLSYLDKVVDFDVMAQAIIDCEADIVGLNEMRSVGVHHEFVDQAGILAEKTGLENYYFAKALDVYDDANPYGNALLSKYAIVESETIPIPDPEPKQYKGYYETRCILKAKLENGITVLVTHFGLNPDEHENAVKTILENIEDEKCILMGDFNVSESSDVLDPIREVMIDASEAFEVQPMYSYPSDKPKSKIDYIFVSKDIELVEADIPAIMASDHRPHTASVIIE